MLRAAKDVLGEGEEFPSSLGTCLCVHSLYIDVLYTHAVVLLVGMGIKESIGIDYTAIASPVG